ncbi:hypothetical protein GW17_00057770 [Ensete ventricosum]|nr:hypothetical protein GW17_00057770 [Ensete ventricosum]
MKHHLILIACTVSYKVICHELDVLGDWSSPLLFQVLVWLRWGVRTALSIDVLEARLRLPLPCLSRTLADFTVLNGAKLLALPEGLPQGVQRRKSGAIAQAILLMLLAELRVERSKLLRLEWRRHFFIVDGSEDWGFPTVWAVHTIDNALPALFVGETEALERIQ